MILNNCVSVKENVKEKTCRFPGCDKIYFGTGYSKYCPEHRKQEYRKIIDEKRKTDEKEKRILNNSNQTIKHNFKECKIIKVTCQLCLKQFDVLVMPNVYVYPKYCEDHRNEYKRKIYEKNSSA